MFSVPAIDVAFDLSSIEEAKSVSELKKANSIKQDQLIVAFHEINYAKEEIEFSHERSMKLKNKIRKVYDIIFSDKKHKEDLEVESQFNLLRTIRNIERRLYQFEGSLEDQVGNQLMKIVSKKDENFAALCEYQEIINEMIERTNEMIYLLSDDKDNNITINELEKRFKRYCMFIKGATISAQKLNRDQLCLDWSRKIEDGYLFEKMSTARLKEFNDQLSLVDSVIDNYIQDRLDQEWEKA